MTGGALATSDESDAVRYFVPDALPPNTFPEHVHRIRDALRGEPRTLLKAAEGPSSRVVARGGGAGE